MKTIGILGGIASGKSAATDVLRSLGAVVFDADQAGHQVLRLPEVKEEIRARFSPAVFDEQGEVSRRKVAERVFGPTAQHVEALTDLEKITHPRIKIELVAAQEAARQEGAPAFVIDAPVMIKAGWHRRCDLIVFVEASRASRLARAQARSWTENEFDRREASQEELEVKRALADFIVTNDSSLACLADQIQTFWSQHITPLPSFRGIPQ